MLVTAIALAVMSWRCWLRQRYFLHMFQLEGYKLNEYKNWRGHNNSVLLTLSHKLGIGIVVLILVLVFFRSPEWLVVAVSASWIPVFLLTPRYGSEGHKKALAYTDRLKRLRNFSFLLSLALFLGITILLLLIALRILGMGYAFPAFFSAPVAMMLVDLGMPQIIALAGRILAPIERQNHNRFKTQAKKKLADLTELNVVGITGSYGKTSVKFITAEILAQKYSVLATPSSYNTPMGICKVVNNDLNASHQVFIAEMGARYDGDIEELVELVSPDIGIVTSVGPAHLETMGPIENIQKVKAELVVGLPESGLAILNADDDRVEDMAKLSKAKILRVSTKDQSANFVASQIEYDATGSRFTVTDTASKESQDFQTTLLGEHNVLNILFGIALGAHLEIKLRQMAHAVKRIEPVPHRLALRQQGGLTIIDDAFNSNPVGSKNAIDILYAIPTGKKIVITPGMVELGEEQDRYNEEFGAYMAGKVDLAILVGKKQSEPIRRGLEKAGQQADKIITVTTLFEAQDLLASHTSPGDVVLYENDLPDQYNE